MRLKMLTLVLRACICIGGSDANQPNVYGVSEKALIVLN